MSAPLANLQLIYVSDIEISTRFYTKLFQLEPCFITPRYVAFKSGQDTLFALWSGGSTPDPATPRFSEIGFMLPSSDDVQRRYDEWCNDETLNFIQAPVKEVFGLTFLLKDPDGHVIRVCPLD